MTDHTIVICMGSSCFSRGNEANLIAVRDFIARHQLGKSIHLKGSRCEGRCLNGPNLSVDGKVFEKVTPEDVDKILTETLLEGADQP